LNSTLFQGPQKFTHIGLFGLKIYHLATLIPPLLPAKPAHQPTSPSKGTVPCQNCGSLQIVAFKGGGYNMTPQ
jgi:hypothetical protein